MTDPYAETDEGRVSHWPQIVPVAPLEATHSPEQAASEGSDADDAEGALVERLAEAIAESADTLLPSVAEDWMGPARAVLPVVAAEVEAAVSVVRAEVEVRIIRLTGDVGTLMAEKGAAESEVAQLREALRIGTELDNHHNADACPYCQPADLGALREKVAKVEALAEPLAAALEIALMDAHPVYGSTSGWRGGPGGSAMTAGCSMIDPPPGMDWLDVGLGLLTEPLRDYLRYREESGEPFDRDAAKAAVEAKARAALSDPTTPDQAGGAT